MLDTLHLVLRLRGGGFSPITLDIYFNDELKDKITFNTYEEVCINFGDFITNEFAKLKIKGNINDFDYYNEENLINDKLNEELIRVINSERKLKIFSKMNNNLPKEDNIVLSQEMNGLWKMDIAKLGWLNFTKAKWIEFLKKNNNKIKEIFKKDISEEAIFNIVLISYIMTVAKGRMRYKLIIRKAIKGLNKKWPEINEEQVKLFKNEIKV